MAHFVYLEKENEVNLALLCQNFNIVIKHIKIYYYVILDN